MIVGFNSVTRSPYVSVQKSSLFTLENLPNHKVSSQQLNCLAVLRELTYTENLLPECRHCYWCLLLNLKKNLLNHCNLCGAGEIIVITRWQLSAWQWLMSAVILYRWGNVMSRTSIIIWNRVNRDILFPVRYIHSVWSHLTPEQTFQLSDGTSC